MLESILRKNIPTKLKKFPKLTVDKDPYYFQEWDKSSHGTVIRYWFWNKNRTKRNSKRVFIQEIKNLLQQSISGDKIDRSLYKKCCGKTQSDGPCGYAVIIAILEILQVGERKKIGKKNILIDLNKENIEHLLESR